jgi:hypothetical protein
MTGDSGVFIADLEDGCPAAAFWVAYFDHLPLPSPARSWPTPKQRWPAGTTPTALKVAWGTAGAAPPTSTGSAP